MRHGVDVARRLPCNGWAVTSFRARACPCCELHCGDRRACFHVLLLRMSKGLRIRLLGWQVFGRVTCPWWDCCAAVGFAIGAGEQVQQGVGDVADGLALADLGADDRFDGGYGAQARRSKTLRQSRREADLSSMAMLTMPAQSAARRGPACWRRSLRPASGLHRGWRIWRMKSCGNYLSPDCVTA